MMTWNSIYFSNPSSYLMELIVVVHDYVMMFLVSIMISILVVMTNSYFSSSFNLGFLSNHELETVWTVFPVFVLIFIGIPSVKSLYILDSCILCGINISIMGHQWYWSYSFKDFNECYFDSYMMGKDSSNLRLVDVDNRIIVPSKFPVRLLVSSADVIHSWTIPSLGVKCDAVPGRINQLCFESKRSGIFFGQCSEICGANHSFMPIVMESVPVANFFKFFNV